MVNYDNTGQRYRIETQDNKIVTTLSCGHCSEVIYEAAEQAQRQQKHIGGRTRCPQCPPRQ